MSKTTYGWLGFVSAAFIGVATGTALTYVVLMLSLVAGEYLGHLFGFV